MGLGNSGQQSYQRKEKTKEIQTVTGQVLQSQGHTVLAQKDAGAVNATESSKTVNNVFELKIEREVNIAFLKKENTTQKDRQDNTEKRLMPVSGVSDLVVEQRRKSILRGSELSDVEKKMYVRDADYWQAVRMSSPIFNYPQELRDSNEKLMQLTNLLAEDKRGASESFEKARVSMALLTKLCSDDESQDYEELSAEFGSRYEIAYQNACGAVEEYLQSHAALRKSYKGWQRKSWMNKLKNALQLHGKYAAEIISGYTAIAQFRDRFSEGQGQEEIYTQTDAIGYFTPDTLSLEDIQDTLVTGTPQQVVKALIDIDSVKQKAKQGKWGSGTEFLNFRAIIMEKLDNSTFAEKVEYARILVCAQMGLKQQFFAWLEHTKKEAPEGTDADEYAMKKLYAADIYTRYQSCVKLIEELEKRSFGRLLTTGMQQEWNGRDSIWKSGAIAYAGLEIPAEEQEEEKKENEQKETIESQKEEYLSDEESLMEEKQLDQHKQTSTETHVNSLHESYQQLLSRISKKSNTTLTHLKEMLGSFLEKDYSQPAGRVAYVNLFWTIKNTINNYLQSGYDGLELCLQIDEQLNELRNQMLENGVMKPEETEDDLPSLEAYIEFPGTATKMSKDLHSCGSSEKLEKMLTMKSYTSSLKDRDRIHLQNRIHICKRLENLEAKKENVVPSPCSVYLNGKNVPLTSVKLGNIGQYKFILEDVVQSHCQTHSMSCWSAAAENLFRQRGVFLHQADIRGYRDSEMDDECLGELKDNKMHNLHSLGNLVGKVMKNTALRSQQLSGFIEPDGHLSGVQRNAIYYQLRETILDAVVQEHSAIAISFAKHYRTIVGIEGDTVYYKDSQNRTDPNKMEKITIDGIIDMAEDAAYSAGEEMLGIEMFWMKDIPAGTNMVEKYKNILKPDELLQNENGKYKMPYEKSDQIRDDMTTVIVGYDVASDANIYNRDYIPRSIN